MRRPHLLAALLLSLTTVPATADVLATINEGSTATLTLRFTEPPRCVGGPSHDALCTTVADCATGATGCVAHPAVPASVTYRLDFLPTSPPRAPVALLPPTTVTPTTDTVTVTLPSAAFPVIRDVLDVEPHRLTVTWTTASGGQQTDDRVVLVRNLPFVAVPTPTP